MRACARSWPPCVITASSASTRKRHSVLRMWRSGSATRSSSARSKIGRRRGSCFSMSWSMRRSDGGRPREVPPSSFRAAALSRARRSLVQMRNVPSSSRAARSAVRTGSSRRCTKSSWLWRFVVFRGRGGTRPSRVWPIQPRTASGGGCCTLECARGLSAT